MKTSSNKSVGNGRNTKSKTGFLPTHKIRRMFHLNNTATATNVQPSPILAIVSLEKERLSYTLEAELKKATAQVYANITPIR